MYISSFLIFISSALMLVGTYVIWFSRYNIPTHLTLGTLFVAYFVPLFFTDLLSDYPSEIITRYACIMTLGSLFYVMGLIYGFNYVPIDKLVRRPTYAFSSLKIFMLHRYNYLTCLTVIALVVMALSWMYIGTVPMFAANPFAAKFFKGEYHDAYMRVAIPYRLAQTIQITLFPILVALWFLTRRKLLLLLIILIMLFFSMALTRALVFSGVFTLIALFSTRKRIYVFWFILGYVAIVSIGSAIYFLASLLLGHESFGGFNTDGANIWTVIAAGSPDISDQIKLLSAFENHGEFTFGRTFWGGLVPGQYYWNPSAWSLYMVNNTDDISDIASGGFRVPVAMWGYFAFGWIGAVVVPAISGVILGASTRYIKKIVSHKNVLSSILALSFYTTVMGFFYGFYAMSMYSLPACAILIVLLYRFRWRSSRVRQLNV